MTMLAEAPSSTTLVRPGRRGTAAPDARLAQRIRAEFLEMPGLKLTVRQAARVFGADPTRVEQFLEDLRAERFLVRDTAGTFRRCTGLDERRPVTSLARDLAL